MRAPNYDDPDLPLSELMTLWPQTIPVFLRHKMLCVGCMVGPFHTITDACTEYHLDYDAFMEEVSCAMKA